MPNPKAKNKNKKYVKPHSLVNRVAKGAVDIVSRGVGGFLDSILLQKEGKASISSSSSNSMQYTGYPSQDFPTGASSRRPQRKVVEEDEYIAEVNGTTASFGSTAYAINPGQATTFPWLAKEALQWEKWGVSYCVFYYKPEVSQFATNGQSGKIMLSADYDAGDSAPVSKQEVEATVPHSDGMPYECVYLSLDPRRLVDNPKSGKFVRPGNLPGGSDIKTYDGGNLFVSTYNNAATTVLGELRVKYKFWFSEPILNPTSITAPMNNSVTTLQGNALTPLTTATLADVMHMETIYNGLGITTDGTTITLPPGNYIIDVDIAFLGSTVNMLSGGWDLVFNGIYLAPGAAIPSASSFYSFDVNNTAPSEGVTGHSSYYLTVASLTSELLLRCIATFSSGTVDAQPYIRIVAV